MRVAFRFLAVALLLAPTAALAQAGPAAPPLKRVMLSSGGLAYFEHEAIVEGDAELRLELRLDQIDDALKSLVVFDDKGGVGGVRLPVRRPLAEIFRGYPFPPEALGSPAALLNALQGSEIAVSGPKPIAGRLLQAVPETVDLGEGRTALRHRLSLMTQSGLQHVVLEEADAIAFRDPQLEAAVREALQALDAHRSQDRRALTIIAAGEGRRAVRIGYVVAAPLWKASYRLTAPADPNAEKAHLQGWAILENLSGQDWRDVELTLVSGNPVAFRQALYEAYFVNRPEVPVEVLGRVLPPRPDEGAITSAASEAEIEMRAKAAPAPMARQEMAQDRAGAAAPTLRYAPAAGATPVAAEEAATQVTFRYGKPVSVAAGESLVIPIVDREAPAARLSLYQQGLHPLAAVRLDNDAETGLPPGAITVYERSGDGLAYAGDARLGPLPAGEKRLLSFAVDQRTKVDREQAAARRLDSAKVSRGVLRLTSVERQTTTYRIAAPAREPRRLVLEHPIAPGWKLVEPDETTAERTPSHWRFTVALKPGEQRAFAVALERPLTETLRVAELSSPQVAAYAAAPELDAKTRAAFAELARLRGAVEEARQTIEQLEGERRAIFEDQSRLRENLQSTPRESELYRRYLDKLGGQETRLDELARALDAAREAERKASDALAEYVEKLEI